MLTLKREWFADSNRLKIASAIEEQATKRLSLLMSYEIANQTDQDFVHRTNCILGELTTLTSLNYLLVDTTQIKPWLIRKSIAKVLDLEETLTYIQTLKDWLIKQPPSTERGLLIQIQIILKNLTEIKYE